MKIILEKSKCIGCGSCMAVCPKFFEMGEDGKSHLKDSNINPENQTEEIEKEDSGCVKEAAGVCPVQCIHIKTT